MHCSIGQNWLDKNCDGFIFSEVYADIYDHIAEYPKIAKSLQILCDGIKQKWQLDGILLPIPETPPLIIEETL